MHRKPEPDMFPLDIELERTLSNLRKVRSAETTIMADGRMGQTVDQETQKGLRCKIQWRIYGDQLSKKNIQQLDNLL